MSTDELLNMCNDNDSLQSLSDRLDLLLERITHLQMQNKVLIDREKSWQRERIKMHEINKMALSKVNTVISRLKEIESESH